MDNPETPESQTTAPAAPGASAPAAQAPAGTEADAQAAAQAAEEELNMIKAVVLDSAELATRSASLATNAGTAMREATEVMMKTHAKQRKQSMILLIVTGALMLITACVFMGVSVTLFSRLKTVDAMLLAVGKRVTELNTTMETVASVNEALQNLAGQQEQAHKQQQQLEAKLDEVLKSTQGMPAAAAKQLEDKSQAIVKQVQSMDARMQSQAASLQRLSQQVKGLEGQIADSGQKIRSEVENMSRQQRERQLQAEQAAAKAAAQKPKEREPLLQYPRLPIPGASAPATVRP